MANLGMPDEIGEPIVTREFDSARGPVTVEIAAPVRVDKPNPWMCGLRITGLKNLVVLWMPGIDSMQALLLALNTAGDVLAKVEPPLTWLRGANLQLPLTDAEGNHVIYATTETEDAEVLGEVGAAAMHARIRSASPWLDGQTEPEDR